MPWGSSEIAEEKKRWLTEHPDRPHAHEAPDIWLVWWEEQIEGQHTANQHWCICLHLKDSVQCAAWLSWVLAFSTWCSGSKRCCCLSHCLAPDKKIIMRVMVLRFKKSMGMMTEVLYSCTADGRGMIMLTKISTVMQTNNKLVHNSS